MLSQVSRWAMKSPHKSVGCNQGMYLEGKVVEGGQELLTF